jgi:hypothetical protein
VDMPGDQKVTLRLLLGVCPRNQFVSHML